MTVIKLCGLSRPCDIETANLLKPDYIGFVFAKKSRRFVPPDHARELKQMLNPGISAVGVFVNESPEIVASLLNGGVIDVAQLHGGEDEDYISRLRTLTRAPLIKAFRIDAAQDVAAALRSSADHILLDSGSGGTGNAFDWTLLREIERPYFLAGGLRPENAAQAVRLLHPWGVDVSSGIETNQQKDPDKMRAFVRIVREQARKDELP